MRRGGPPERRTPLRNRTASAAKIRTSGWGGIPLPRAGPRRRRGPRRSRKTRTEAVAGYLRDNPRCELTAALDRLGPPGWEEYKRAWAGHPLGRVVDPHHVHGRREGDEVWNLVSASRVAHEYVQGRRWGRAVCCLVKQAKGEFQVRRASARLRRDVLGVLAAELDAGVYAAAPELRRAVAGMVAAARGPR